MATAIILNFCKSGILGHSNSCMLIIDPHTKFKANIFINDRDMAKNPKSKMAATAILCFGKIVIFTARRYASTVLAVIVCPSVHLSVCLSVCPSQVGVVQRWLNLGSD